MPKVRRRNVPRAVLDHLRDRMLAREIPAEQLGLLAEWLDGEPEVPVGKWFKRFPGMIACGEGELVKTFCAWGNCLPARSCRESSRRDRASTTSSATATSSAPARRWAS